MPAPQWQRQTSGSRVGSRDPEAGALGFRPACHSQLPPTVSSPEASFSLRAGPQRNERAQHGLSPFTDPEVPFSWSQEDVSDLYSHTTILLAAEGKTS